ncbi:hypothetical protein DFH07DRAFT_737298, partial [Mycena maculata]
SYLGYKPRQYFHIDNGVRDQLEQYNSIKSRRYTPEAIRLLLGEIDAFARHTHFNVLHPAMLRYRPRLLALGLELLEEALVDIHDFSSVGETYAIPGSQDDELKTKNVCSWLDIGTITVLYSQSISALQILWKDGQWKWIKHIENGLVINVGDALEFLSGGYYKATIHRIVRPPVDQQAYNRLSLFNFCLADNDVKLVPFSESPVLKRAGILRRFDDQDAPTMEAWRKARTSAYGQSQLKAGKVEEEVIAGVVVEHYN